MNEEGRRLIAGLRREQVDNRGRKVLSDSFPTSFLFDVTSFIITDVKYWKLTRLDIYYGTWNPTIGILLPSDFVTTASLIKSIFTINLYDHPNGKKSWRNLWIPYLFFIFGSFEGGLVITRAEEADRSLSLSLSISGRTSLRGFYFYRFVRSVLFFYKCVCVCVRARAHTHLCIYVRTYI